ncbi:hypothetical protein HC256_004274 [Beauveria bassiana]|nr:hypothetical protein HC256_004274 [Beauveria bassiana]
MSFFSFVFALAVVNIGHAIPQDILPEDTSERYIVGLKDEMTKADLDAHLDFVRGLPDQPAAVIEDIFDDKNVGFFGYIGLFAGSAAGKIRKSRGVDTVVDVPTAEAGEDTGALSKRINCRDESTSTGGREGKKTTTGGVLSEGQGYNTFLGKGLLLDNVIFPSEAVAKRDALLAGEDDPETAFNFTAPSANLSGIVVDEYFARPKHRTRPHSLAELKKHSNSTLPAVHSNFTLPAVQRRTTDVRKCNAKIKTHYEFVEDYGYVTCR